MASIAKRPDGRWRARYRDAAGKEHSKHFARKTDARQLVTVTGRPSFLTAPKTAASVRTIPLPQVVLDALAAHLGAFPPLGDGFVFVTDARNPIRRTAFGDVWRAAVKAAGRAGWDRLS